MSVVRGRPPGLAGGMSGSNRRNWSSVSAWPEPKSPTSARSAGVHMAISKQETICNVARWARISPSHQPHRPFANGLLVVHPLSCCGIWHDGDPGAARGAVPPSTAPDERMLVRVPVRGGAPDGFFDLGPGLET